MSTFILSPASDIPESADLNLLPFALTPTPSKARIATFFRPRKAPPGHNVPEGTPIATFRGRQVVGQLMRVPRGYKGVILRAIGAPATAAAPASSAKYPLTPAPSLSNSTTPIATDTTTASAAATAAAAASASSTSGPRTRARGAGQVALARPQRTRGRVKRIKMEVESDEEDDGDVVKPIVREDKVTVAVETTVETNPDMMEVAVDVEVEVEDKARELEHTDTTHDTPTEGVNEANSNEANSNSNSNEDTAATATAEYDADGLPTRRLVPVSTFGSFVLWTPDTALAGFDPKEGDADTGEETGTKAQGSGAQHEENSASRLQDAWWRRGGGGEGGDEFVRALGEWVGLNEVVSGRQYKGVDGADCRFMSGVILMMTMSRGWTREGRRLDMVCLVSDAGFSAAAGQSGCRVGG